jgi:rhamnogalacturonan acetylesterase
VNDAIAGTSARSYYNGSHFSKIASLVTVGNYVIIEFGHNDGGSLSPDNGRSDCAGSGSQTCTTAAGVVVQTYVTYLTEAAKAIVAKGAKVIVASPTPDNPCERERDLQLYPQSIHGVLQNRGIECGRDGEFCGSWTVCCE